VDEGDVVTVNLYNSLSENVSIVFPGQDMLPDTVGVPKPGPKSYTFTADAPGTYLYEAGTNTQVQVAMGLFGPLIVRPSLIVPTGDGLDLAYNDLSTGFDVEAILVLSEIDPDLNASPSTFNMLDYNPVYWLINGKAYPDTDEILAPAGERVLIRYLNGGLFNHTMKTVGMHLQLIAGDANLLNFSQPVVSLTIASGQTNDLIGIVPSAAPGSQFPLYSAQQNLTNNDDLFPGGMLTFVTVDEPPAPTGSLPSSPDGGGSGSELSVSCARTVSMVDALLIARYVVGLTASLPCIGGADVNGDGSITMMDALKVARSVVGLTDG
jgi:FtsP/CotA-like multicopper oxidase with cupredoxin domain